MKKKLLLVFACFAASIAVLTGCNDKTTANKTTQKTTQTIQTTKASTTAKKTTIEKTTTVDPNLKYKVSEEDFESYFNPKTLDDIKKYNFTVVATETETASEDVYTNTIKIADGKISMKFDTDFTKYYELNMEDGKIVLGEDYMSIEAFTSMYLFPYVSYSDLSFDSSTKSYKTSKKYNFEHISMGEKAVNEYNNIVIKIEDGLPVSCSFDITATYYSEDEVNYVYSGSVTLAFSDFGSTTVDKVVLPPKTPKDVLK